MNLIILPSHGRDNAASYKLYSLYHLLEVETAYEVELLQALQWCLEVLRRLCESCFQKYTARRRLLVQYVYKPDFQLSWKHTAHTKP